MFRGASRRSHKKSRNGCSQCKKRKLKCDERPPRCSNCTRHSIECDFSRLQPGSVQTSAPQQQSGRVSPGISNTAALASHAPAELNVTGPPASFGTLNMDHLELLHHFSTETCFTLSDQIDRQHLFQTVVPKEALSHAFLMRGILAAAAMHLSYLKKGQQDQDRYTKAAEEHQDAGMLLFRSEIGNITPSNCSALFVYSCIVAICTLSATFPSTKVFLVGTGDVEWVYLVQGIRAIILSSTEWIAQGKLGILLNNGPADKEAPLPAVLAQQLEKLGRFCDASTDGDDAKATYRQTLSILKDSLSAASVNSLELSYIGFIFSWPASISSSYLSLLKLQRPEALALLAQYCLLLHRANELWWAEGQAMRLLTAIEEVLIDPWKSWARWPMQHIDILRK